MKTLADETGETLVELMITIMIMAVGVTAVVAALSMTIKGSDLHHSLAQGEVMVRDYGEAIKDKAINITPYKPCPGVADLTPTDFDNGTTPVAGPGDKWFAAITGVEYWSGDGNTTFQFTDQATCIGDADSGYTKCVNELGTGGFAPACDPGYEIVTYKVWNERTDHAKVSETDAIEARVLIRRNNESS